MRGRVMEISSVSHLLMKDGKKCDKYTATIKVRVATYKAILRFYYIVIEKTAKAVEKELEKYDLGQVYSFDSGKLVRTRI